MASDPRPAPARPVLAGPGESPATASRPDVTLDDRHLVYDTNPVPWWLALVWLGFFVFGLVYLLTSLLAPISSRQ
jgi:hypothetical protein